jgi:hypothetical protein
MSILFIVIGSVSLGGIFYRIIAKASARQESGHYKFDEEIN